MVDSGPGMSVRDEKRTIRINLNRQEEISFKKELSHANKKLQLNINLDIDKTNQEPTSESHFLTKYGSEFLPKPPKKERKFQPIFHDNVKTKDVKLDQYMFMPNIPAFSPVDEGSKTILESRKKRYPYVHQKIITVEEMKKPKISSLGVVPIRACSAIETLSVMLEGTAAKAENTEIMLPPKLYNTPASSFIVSGVEHFKEMKQANHTVTKSDDKQSDAPKKPAILPGVGTTAAVKLTERAKPAAKVSYLKQNRKKSALRPVSKEGHRVKTADSFRSSLMSTDLNLPDDATYTAYDDTSETYVEDVDIQTYIGQEYETQRSEQSSGQTVKSLQELLEEAKQISDVNSEPIYRQNVHKKTNQNKGGPPQKNEGKLTHDANNSDKQISKKKSQDIKNIMNESQEIIETKRVERTVDEIIASLKDQTAYNQETEADRKIKEIMKRVMSRANIEEESKEDVKEEKRESSALQLELNLDIPPIIISDESSVDDAKIDRKTPNADIRSILSPGIKFEDTVVFGSETIEPLQQSLPLELTFSATEMAEENECINEEKAQSMTDTLIDYEQALKDLMLPTKATPEDILSIQGEKKGFKERKLPAPDIGPKINVFTPSVSFLSTWAPHPALDIPESLSKSEEINHTSIHHFCHNTMEYQLPPELLHAGRKYHTPDRFISVMPDQPYRFKPGDLPLISENNDIHHNSLERSADRVVQSAAVTASQFFSWQKHAAMLFEGKDDIIIEGRKMQLKSDESQVYWNPAPPKLVAAPQAVNELLFPLYQSEDVEELALKKHTQEENEKSESSEDEKSKKLVLEKKNSIERTIRKRHNSDRTEMNVIKEDETGELEQSDEALMGKMNSVDEAQVIEGIEQIHQRQKKLSKKRSLNRPTSAPCLFADNDDTLIIPQDYNTAMHEIIKQKKLLENAKQSLAHHDEKNIEDNNKTEEFKVPVEKDINLLEINKVLQKVKEKPTLAEQALQAGRNYVLLPKKKKKRKNKRTLDKAKLLAAEQMLMFNPTYRKERRDSMPKLHKIVERELRVSWQIRNRRYSIPNLLNFEEFKTRKRMSTEEDEREWVRGIWNVWFDEVFPPTPQDSEEEESVKEITAEKQKVDDKEEKKKIKKVIINEVLSQDIEAIEPIADTQENREIYQILQEEITKLSLVIDNMTTPTAFDLCRRGALYRKVGMLKKAESDLNMAIEMEPDLLDAYWHRHLLYILQDRKSVALEDLSFIMKKNKNHSGAYRSMAEIYKQQDDITMAIINYSSAIKYNPVDHEAYFQRAQLYEKRGDMLLAMEDYTNAMKIMPYRTDAMMRHGMYYFENENWGNAVHDFTELLKVEPLNAKARLLRGRAYAKMSNWVSALEDFSATIHLDPLNWQAFYQRACILQKAHPEKALLDLSVSLLLNDTDENIMAYLHRGILYNTLGNSEDAIPDFESVLKLNPDMAPAHVNLGLIYMTRYFNYHRAIKKFTAAIKVDPTYVRAYVCRGEAYHKIHELKNALKDFTRAIHLRPDVHHYYMYRGQLVLKMGNFDLAAFCVSHAAEIGMDDSNSSLGVSPNQQAVVQSFLKNFDKAIDALQQAVRAKPTAATFMLLGKTFMKAKQYKEASVSFNEALDKMKPWKKGDSWPKEAAEAHYLSGLCHIELRNYSDAQLQFNHAIKLNSSFADAYYQRGLASVKLRHVKGIQDFNKALALNPNIFQAYLSRACYYGQKGKYAKAILNCNEAIKIQPKCVRGYLYRGALKYWIKAYDLAILDLTKAAVLDKECPIPYFNRAVCYHESGQHEKALIDYSIVLMLGNMLDLKVLINRGLLYFERKDYKNALFDLQAAAKLHPTDHRIHHTIGLCYHKLHSYKEAVIKFNKCLQLKPFFLEGFIARGNVFMDFGHQQGITLAKRDYQRALRIDPLFLPARVNLAYTAQVSSKLMQAWKHFSAIIDVKPGYRPALEGRAIVNLQMGNTFGAFQDISLSINYGPSAELLTNRGVINQFRGDSVMAMQDYQRAIKLDPTFSLAYYNAGNIYFHTRHFKQALEYYTLSIKYNYQNESAYINRAITKVLLHDTQGAFEDFELAAELCPFSAHIYFNRANLYASLGQYETAEKEYTKALELKPDDPMMLKKRADARGHQGKRSEAIEDYKRAVDIQTRPNKLIADS